MDTFYEHFQNCAKYNRWREIDRLAHLKSVLVGDAGQLLWDTPPTETDTVDKLVQLLRNRFGGAKQVDKYRMELRLRRRLPEETLSQLHQSIRCLMALAHPTLKADERETIACDYFVDALDDPDFALKVRERAPSTLDDALRISLQLEAWNKDAQRQRGERQPSQKTSSNSKLRSINANSDNDSVSCDVSDASTLLVDNVMKKMDELLCAIKGSNCKSEPSPVPAKPNPQQFRKKGRGSPPAFANPHRACYNCGNPGHLRRNCPFPRQQPNDDTLAYGASVAHQPIYSASVAPQPVTQYNDVITSQVTPMMPVQQRPVVTTYSVPQPAVVTTQAQATSSARGQKGLDIEPVYLVMGLGKKEHPCLLDSGCEKTLVPLSVVQTLRKVHIRPTSFHITCVNDTTLDVVGRLSFLSCCATGASRRRR